MEMIIECSCGKVKGEVTDHVAVFKGLPFAKTKRFCPPELIRQWENGFFDGTGMETDCFQRHSFEDESKSFYHKEFRSNRQFRDAESPMTLNIVAQCPIQAEAGTSSDPEDSLNGRSPEDILPPAEERISPPMKRDLSPLAEKRRPVLIFFHGGGFETGTVGELPYGTCPEYAKRDILFVSAGYRLNVFGLYGGENFGLQDQIAAIDWVRENIASFGGDPEKITIIGQSAGGMCIMDLLCSGKLNGKITHAIMMSGAGIVPGIAAPVKKEKARKFWDQVDQALEEDPQKASPEKLWRTWRKVQKAQKLPWKLRISQPSIDGAVMTESQKRAVQSGHFQNIPIMIGITSQDYMPIFVYEMALSLALKLSRLGHAPVYGYLFDRVLPGNSFKAFHASDLWYVFGSMDQSWRPFEKNDYELSGQMIDAVASFCRTGTPGDPSWPPVTPHQKGFRHYDGVSSGLAKPSYCRKKMRETLLKTPGPM